MDTRISKRGLILAWAFEKNVTKISSFTSDLWSPVLKFKIDGFITKWKCCCEIAMNCLKGFSLKRLDDEAPENVSVGFELTRGTTDGNVKIIRKKDQNEFEKNCLYYVYNSRESQSMENFMFESLLSLNGSIIIQLELWPCFPRVAVLTKYVVKTHLEVKRFVCQRIFRNVSDWTLHQKVEFSPPLSQELVIGLSKTLGAFETLSVSFCYTHPFECNIKDIKLKMSVFHSDGTLLIEKFHQVWNKENCTEKCSGIWKFIDAFFSNTVSIKELKANNVSIDVLNFKFEFTLHSTSSKILAMICDVIEVNEINRCVSSPQTQYWKTLYSEKKHADVKLRTSTETLLAHKAILCVGSPVFDAMFDNDMFEKESGIIEIQDIDASTLDKLLLFMYTGLVEDLQEETALKLMSAADKYQVLPLKHKCASFLKDNLSIENACLILTLADAHYEESLKKSAVEFICKHHHGIFDSDDWGKFIKSHGELASEIFQSLSKKYLNN